MARSGSKAVYAGYASGRSLAETNTIRSLARKSAMASPVQRKCAVCGRDRGIQVCHIKPICSFPIGTPVDVINADSNLVILCANDHFDLDHGYLKNVLSLEDTMRKPMPNLLRVMNKRRRGQRS